MDPYSFLGKGLKFPLQVDKKTGYISMVTHEEDIRESIGIILNTYLGERVMRSSFGTNIQDYLFDVQNVFQIHNVAGSLARSLTVQEPRIRDVEVELEQGDEAFQGQVVLKISYTIRSTNNRYNHVYPFYIDEGNQEESII